MQEGMRISDSVGRELLSMKPKDSEICIDDLRTDCLYVLPPKSSHTPSFHNTAK